ncbi:hypothetical protein CHGG_07621 [Chaetomium globosum CBS 148.51]|uniref:20S-pre-rRNA D-site endonuclease NOB1 n=1 Tax=Chaetomium globosum (strain ATCC 6205 / CBS 148.51 / DSM 1962 / NBRC 6347 / NRRL 1970) TaxID=306901 RepID=Q2GWN3_CHAGB|nr:uncharacterized protein CHGG_07621 [Chaetomium globosum CBS 148.51]EAQ86368.1 hypothetical protein CHGG_07621 [Chaetomium globosum CBS 148.51]
MEETTSEPVAQAQSEVQNPAPTTIETATSVPTSSSPATTTPTTAPSKPIHSLVIDANAIIKNDPTVSTLLAQADKLYTIPAVVSEIRDAATRSRFETTLSPFLKLRNPRPESVQFVTNFARRTGDLQVLSKPDIHLLALTYDLEIERNGGDWRLRREPNQKGVNGKPPGKTENEAGDAVPTEIGASAHAELSAETPEVTNGAGDAAADVAEDPALSDELTTEAVTEQLQDLALNPTTTADDIPENADESSEDDGDGEWITPSNIKKYQARENAHTAPQTAQRVLQAALITGDMAMRNVALRINLNTDSGGNFTLHLKKNFQYNNRGNVFSIPKPTHGSASGKSNAKGGGKNGWGKELIFAEDQKEYTKKLDEERRLRTRDIMDQDYLPSILGGSRTSGGGRIKVGAGRNVNAKKRK